MRLWSKSYLRARHAEWEAEGDRPHQVTVRCQKCNRRWFLLSGSVGPRQVSRDRFEVGATLWLVEYVARLDSLLSQAYAPLDFTIPADPAAYWWDPWKRKAVKSPPVVNILGDPMWEEDQLDWISRAAQVDAAPEMLVPKLGPARLRVRCNCQADRPILVSTLRRVYVEKAMAGEVEVRM